MDNVMNIIKKIGYFVLQYLLISYQWILKFIKVQLQKFKKSGVQKNLTKSYSALGAEVYSLYKQGITSDLRQIPVVEQQLKNVEEAESAIFQADEGINEIQSNYFLKKEEILKNYTEKRTTLEVYVPEEAKEKEEDSNETLS